MAVERNVTEQGAFCKLTTAGFYGRAGVNGNDKYDFNIVTVCDGARIRSATLNKADDLSTCIISFKPMQKFNDLNQQQVVVLSLSRKFFERRFGSPKSLLAVYGKKEANQGKPTILNNVPMEYNEN